MPMVCGISWSGPGPSDITAVQETPVIWTFGSGWIRKTAQAVVRMLLEFIRAAPTADDMLKRPYLFRMGRPPNQIEFITDITGVEFDACFPRGVDGAIEGIPVRVIGLADLLTNKRAAGRDKDMMDAKMLTKYHKIAKGKKKR